jgi:anhydro-N-acetylmuramic acid kinase
MTFRNETYVGLMSGTSLDAVDTVLVQFSEHPSHTAELLAAREHPFPPQLQAELQAVIEAPDNVGLDTLGTLDRQLGMLYAEAVNTLLKQAGLNRQQIAAIGNHGQTIRHSPDTRPAFTLQIGDAATIAAECGIPTVGQFRNADIALGGQGAPLVPAFHEWAFSDPAKTSIVANIGGIANISVLRPSRPPEGFDTGPGNTLMDSWFHEHHEQCFDLNGDWAASGTVLPALLDKMLADPFFSRPAPKSTGREHFNLGWLDSIISCNTAAAPADIQATLAELTASSIAAAIKSRIKEGNVWLCGGGAQNNHLVQRIISHLPGCSVASTAVLGIAPGWVEAVAFAWLARARLHGKAAGIPNVTGARARAILGCVHLPPEA